MPRNGTAPRRTEAAPELDFRAKAAAELLRRRRARESTLEFTQYVNAKYAPGNPHRKISAKLDRVLQGVCKRLMVLMPPQHGKSELGSRKFPALYVGKYPHHNIISASYEEALASAFGRDVRNIVASQAYRDLFPQVELSEDSKAKGNWHVSGGGLYLAGGIGQAAGGGTGITGRGADLLTIDDPLKDRSSAENAKIRQHVYDWYTSTAYTRLAPDAAIVLIQTRWHEDDLAGRLINEMKNGGDQWEILELSAVDEHGSIQAVWPERYSVKKLEQIQKALGGPDSRDWMALYGQRPAPITGALFKTNMIQILPASVPGTTVRGWDLAATRETGTRDPSWTTGVKMTQTLDGRFIVDHVVRFRGGPEEVVKTILATSSQDGHNVKISLPQDPGQAGKAQVFALTQKLAGYNVHSSPESGDKATRAAPVIAQANVGNLFLVEGPWNANYLQELAVFPNGTHEDQVDGTSRAFNVLTEQMSGLSIWEKLGDQP